MSCLIFLLLAPLGLRGQHQFRIGEWNVENLFDYKHEDGKDDVDFLPDSERKWDRSRYWKKLNALSKVLIALSDNEPVDLIALCEVENDSVLYDLTRRTPLRNVGYEYVVTSSPDTRGLDIALLYQPASFRPIHSSSINVSEHRPTGFRPTRDLLHVSGILQTRDTLDIFVCHFPSRRGGVSLTGIYRCYVAGVLRQVVDSVVSKRMNPQIVVLGDFNDGPKDASVRRVLSARPLKNGKTENAERGELYNLTTDKRGKFHKEVRGTYYFQQRWEQLDQIIVNGCLLDRKNRIHTDYSRCLIMDYSFLLMYDNQDNRIPYRTYQGPLYRGGFSDHLPLTVTFSYSW